MPMSGFGGKAGFLRLESAEPGSDAATQRRTQAGGNYASLVARDIGTDLTDVTCRGATTATTGRKITVPASFPARSAGATTTTEAPGIPNSVADYRFRFVSLSSSVPGGSSVRQGEFGQAEFPSSSAIGAFWTLFARAAEKPFLHTYDH